MKNDKEIFKLMTDIAYWCEAYLDYVDTANTCAYTDRIVEHVYEKAEEVKKLHAENFKEV